MSALERPVPGQRIELQGNPVGVKLTARTGTVIRADEWEGYYIVRLDSPAYYLHPNGEVEALFELREAEDNFSPVTDQR